MWIAIYTAIDLTIFYRLEGLSRNVVLHRLDSFLPLVPLFLTPFFAVVIGQLYVSILGCDVMVK